MNGRLIFPFNLLLLLSNLFYLNAQSVFPKLDYKEKTSEIRTEFSDTFLIHNVISYKPFVEYKYFRDEGDVRENFNLLGLNNKYRYQVQYYSRQDSLERLLSNYLNSILISRLRKRTTCSNNHLGTKDSIIVVTQLKRIKSVLTNKITNNYLINDTLNNVLKKHKAIQQVFLTVEMNEIYGHPNSINNWTLYTFYVFDLISKRIFYYNYFQIATHSNGAYFNPKKQDGFERIAKNYLLALKRNKKRFKKIK